MNRDQQPGSDTPGPRDARDARDRFCLAQIASKAPGAEAAVRELYDTYLRPFVAFAIRRGLSEEDAWEATQDAFMNIVRRAGSFRGESRASSWMYGILRNAVIDLHRRRTRDPSAGGAHVAPGNDEEDSTDSIDLLAQQEQTAYANPGERSDAERDQLRDDCVSSGFAAFAKDFPDHAEALHEFVVNGRSIDEVAEQMGRSKGKDGKNGPTRTFLYEGRKKLRAYIQHCLEI